MMGCGWAETELVDVWELVELAEEVEVCVLV
jgi:hypothetical protein